MEELEMGQAPARIGATADGDGPRPQRRRMGLICQTSAGSVALVLGLAAPALAEEDLVKLEFIGCTPAQEGQITEAVALAALAIDQVAARLSGDKVHPDDVDAVARWLGVSRFDAIKDLKHLAARLDATQLPIQAECRPDDLETFAWTYPAMTGTGYISFGYHFFAAHLVGGADSRMGTVVHELSHMVPGTATDDYFYREDQIQALARIFPAVAVDNAQNVEYLIEEIYDRIYGTSGPAKFLWVGDVDEDAHPEPVVREVR
jgi:hypothetical protein